MNPSRKPHSLLIAAVLAVAALSAGLPANAERSADDVHQSLLGTWEGERIGGHPRYEFQEYINLEFTRESVEFVVPQRDGTPKTHSHQDRNVQLLSNGAYRINPTPMQIVLGASTDEIKVKIGYTLFLAKKTSGTNGPAEARGNADGGLQSQWAAAQSKLRAAGKPLTFANMQPLLPTELAQVVRDDAETWRRRCESKEGYSKNHDCKCLEQKFLDQRVAVPTWHHSDESNVTLEKYREAHGGLTSIAYRTVDKIGKPISHLCVDEESMAAHQFKVCHSRFGRETWGKKYCACFAERLAAAYKTNPSPSGYHIRKLGAKAYASCESVRR